MYLYVYIRSVAILDHWFSNNVPQNCKNKLQFRSFVVSYFSHMGPDWPFTWAGCGRRAESLTSLIKVIKYFLSRHLCMKTMSLHCHSLLCVAHHLGGVCQHSPLRASGSGRRLPEAFQTTGERLVRGDRLWQHLLPAKQVSPHMLFDSNTTAHFSSFGAAGVASQHVEYWVTLKATEKWRLVWAV